MRLLSFLAFFLSFFAIYGQEDMSEEQRQEINREMIEAILNMVSPSCRSEMEAAIEEQSDVSNECKIEIQKAVQIISGYNQNQQMQEGEEDQQPSAATNTPPPKNGIHPGYWIALFVVVLVGGVTAYVLHVNKLLEEAFPRKPAKKLSKKKLEKARLKGGQ